MLKPILTTASSLPNRISQQPTKPQARTKSSAASQPHQAMARPISTTGTAPTPDGSARTVEAPPNTTGGAATPEGSTVQTATPMSTTQEAATPDVHLHQARARRFTIRSGSYSGRSSISGNTTQFYNGNGSYAGRAVNSGGTTSFYDSHGAYSGRSTYSGNSMGNDRRPYSGQAAASSGGVMRHYDAGEGTWGARRGEPIPQRPGWLAIIAAVVTFVVVFWLLLVH